MEWHVYTLSTFTIHHYTSLEERPDWTFLRKPHVHKTKRATPFRGYGTLLNFLIFMTSLKTSSDPHKPPHIQGASQLHRRQ